MNTGFILGVVAALAISLTNVFSRAHFEAGSTPTTFLVARYLMFVAFLTVVFAATGRLRRLSGKDYGGVALAGLLNLFGASCLAFAIQRLQVSLAVAVLYLFPFFALIIDALLDRRLPQRRTVLGLVAAFCGLVLALGVGRGSVPDATGVLFAVLAALGIATSFVVIERKLQHVGDVMSLYGISLIGLFGAIILAAATRDVVWPLPTPNGWTTLLIATASFGLASGAMFMSVARIGATRTGLLMNLEPPATTMFALIILGDTISLLQFAGVLIVIAAIIASRPRRHAASGH